MSNEVVKYHNDLNRVVMRDWSPMEMNIFFGILSKVKEQNTKEIILSVNTIKNITESHDSYKKSRWYESLKSLINKLANIHYYHEDENSYEVLMLFQKFKINKDNETLLVKVSPDFEYILNQLNMNFTNWRLEDFIDLKSSYSKTLFRLLKQYRTVGKRRFTIQEFRMLLDIPKSYNTGMVKKRIIDNSLAELKGYLRGLKCKVISENTQGNPIIAYEFTWQAEKTSKYNPNKYNKKRKKDELKPYWATEENKATSKEVESSEKQVNNEVNETELRDELNKMFKE